MNRQFVIFLLFLLSVFAGLAPCNAHADIVVAGGTVQQHELIVKTYDAISPCCRCGCCVSVQVMSEHSLSQYIVENSDSATSASINVSTIDGVYIDNPPTVLLRGDGDCSHLPLTFAHEIGHYIWERVLSGDQKKTYGTIYRAQKAAHSLITTYAGTTVEECFAESYSYYITDCAALSARDNLSTAFINRVCSQTLQSCEQSNK